MKEITDFIEKNWPLTIRRNPVDDGTLIGLPEPYTVPCISDQFQEMYYWDTYFTNVGLILSGRTDQAIHNVNNIAFLIERYGYMPNGNRTFYLSRTQPPFLAKMVMDLYAVTGDRLWLRKMYTVMEKEYAFWQAERMTAAGLNRYSGDTDTLDENLACDLAQRFGYPIPEDPETIQQYSSALLAFAESGWDCNSRFGLQVRDYVPVELNALLWGMENTMAQICKLLQIGSQSVWRERAQRREALINRFSRDAERGVYCDYNFVREQKSEWISAAAFYPLFVGLASRRQAEQVRNCLKKLECEYGISATEQIPDSFQLQWDYPNGWPCLQLIVIEGLINYGFTEDALRIARKYCQTVEKNFVKTGSLWEKYDMTTGEVSASKEYESPKMMGWSAGVYLYCKQLAFGAVM